MNRAKEGVTTHLRRTFNTLSSLLFLLRRRKCFGPPRMLRRHMLLNTFRQELESVVHSEAPIRSAEGQEQVLLLLQALCCGAVLSPESVGLPQLLDAFQSGYNSA